MDEKSSAPKTEEEFLRLQNHMLKNFLDGMDCFLIFDEETSQIMLVPNEITKDTFNGVPILDQRWPRRNEKKSIEGKVKRIEGALTRFNNRLELASELGEENREITLAELVELLKMLKLSE